MDNMPEEIVNSFLLKEVKKPLKYLDDKILNLESVNESKHSELLGYIVALRVNVSELQEELKKSKEENVNLKESLHRYTDELTNSIKKECLEHVKENRDFLKPFVEENRNKIDKFNEDFNSLKKSVIKFSVDIEFLKESSNLVQKIRDLQTLQSKEFSSSKESIDEFKESVSKSIKEFEKVVTEFISTSGLKTEQQTLIFLDLKNSVEKYDNQFKDYALNLSKVNEERFEESMKVFRLEIEAINKKRKHIQSSLEDLKDRVISDKKSGFANKELNDFIKQISYNAVQIEKIHKLLEVK